MNTKTIFKPPHSKCTDVKTLEQWSKDLFYYNGDALILDIWARAGELRNDTKAVAFAKQIKAEFEDQVVDFEEVRIVLEKFCA